MVVGRQRATMRYMTVAEIYRGCEEVYRQELVPQIGARPDLYIILEELAAAFYLCYPPFTEMEL